MGYSIALCPARLSKVTKRAHPTSLIDPTLVWVMCYTVLLVTVL